MTKGGTFYNDHPLALGGGADLHERELGKDGGHPQPYWITLGIQAYKELANVSMSTMRITAVS